MSRKLASVQTISELIPIQNADKIETAKILGWHCVVKKGEFKVGDPIIFCEIDSVLPDKPEYEFMRERKFRVKTIKLRGQISQGLCLPISLLTEKGISVKIGDDVTEQLEIVKYEIPLPACLAGKVIGQFPPFLPKTDETRVQVLQDVLTRYKGTKCYVSEKLDGTSATYFIKDGVFGVCSRNLQLADTENNIFWDMAKKYKIEEKLKALGDNIAIQGEIVGFGIQTNPLKLRDKRFYPFQLFDIKNYKYYNLKEFKETMKKLELETVPILLENFILVDNIDTLVQCSIGRSMLNLQVWREGIVIRPLEEKIDMQMAQGFGNGRVSFKSINPEFLLGDA